MLSFKQTGRKQNLLAQRQLLRFILVQHHELVKKVEHLRFFSDVLYNKFDGLSSKGISDNKSDVGGIALSEAKHSLFRWSKNKITLLRLYRMVPKANRRVATIYDIDRLDRLPENPSHKPCDPFVADHRWAL